MAELRFLNSFCWILVSANNSQFNFFVFCLTHIAIWADGLVGWGGGGAFCYKKRTVGVEMSDAKDKIENTVEPEKDAV